MLSKEEEKKVVSQLKSIAMMFNLDTQMYYWMTAREFQWIATRVIELNDELSKVHEELYKANKELADLTDVE